MVNVQVTSGQVPIWTPKDNVNSNQSLCDRQSRFWSTILSNKLHHQLVSFRGERLVPTITWSPAVLRPSLFQPHFTGDESLSFCSIFYRQMFFTSKYCEILKREWSRMSLVSFPFLVIMTKYYQVMILTGAAENFNFLTFKFFRKLSQVWCCSCGTSRGRSSLAGSPFRFGLETEFWITSGFDQHMRVYVTASDELQVYLST